jgi:hypothetical protein
MKKKDIKMEHVYFTKEQFKQLLKAAKVKLKGRRGLSSKKLRVQKKIVQELVDIVTDEVFSQEV